MNLCSDKRLAISSKVLDENKCAHLIQIPMNAQCSLKGIVGRRLTVALAASVVGSLRRDFTVKRTTMELDSILCRQQFTSDLQT